MRNHSDRMAEEDDTNHYIGDRVKMRESSTSTSDISRASTEAIADGDYGAIVGSDQFDPICSWLEAARLAWPCFGRWRGCDSSLPPAGSLDHRTWPVTIRPTLSQLQLCPLLGGSVEFRCYVACHLESLGTTEVGNSTNPDKIGSTKTTDSPDCPILFR